MGDTEIKKPEYINFLLSRVIQDQLGFHVNVGTPDMEAERIGCLKWMLIARSKVMRKMCYESELKVGDEMDITDLKPNTFKDFLTYVYGHDHTETLGFTESIELLGAAEKYDVEDLKSRLSGLIAPKVSVDTVCTVLEHGPVCETAPQIWEKTTEVIQSKTEHVFEQPQFLMLTSTAVSHILQQDLLSVEEIDVWRASVKWARFQVNGDAAGSHSPDMVRKTMDPLLRYTRICTVPQLEISKEVAPSGILTRDELVEIFISISTQVESAKLGVVCNQLNKRKIHSYTDAPVECCSTTRGMSVKTKASTFQVLVKKSNIELVSGVVLANSDPRGGGLPKGLTYQCEGKITIYKMDFSNLNTSYDLLVEIPFSQNVEFKSDVELKMQIPGGENVVLMANNKYKITVEFTVDHYAFVMTPPAGWDKKVLSLDKFTCLDCRGYYGHHFKSLYYRVQK